MIRATFSSPNVIGVILALSAENLRRLQDRQLITVKLADLGFTGAVGSVHILLCAGETEAQIARDLAPLIGPQTINKL